VKRKIKRFVANFVFFLLWQFLMEWKNAWEALTSLGSVSRILFFATAMSLTNVLLVNETPEKASLGAESSDKNRTEKKKTIQDIRDWDIFKADGES
jgi:hypothetical protein